MDIEINKLKPKPRLQFLSDDKNQKPFQTILIISTIWIAYANSFAGKFLLDDFIRIVENPNGFLPYPTRPVTSLTFALNSMFNDTHVWGYHLINLIIHTISALILYGVAGRTLKCFLKNDTNQIKISWLSTAIAILWAVHPIQTQAVTYIIQRYESMMGMFILLSLYAFIRRWYSLSIIFGMLAVGCKPVAVVLPVILLLYDRTLFSKSFSEIWKIRKNFYLTSLLMWVEAGVFIFFLPATEWQSSGQWFQNYNLRDPLSYWNHEQAIMLHYIKVMFIPTNLCFDCPWTFDVPTWKLISSWGVNLSIIITSFFLFKKNPLITFLVTWFFIWLAPTSSIFPIKDAMFEYRMYIPSIAIIAAFVWATFKLCENKKYLLYCIIIVTAFVLMILTIQRNSLYADEVKMWKDIIEKSPQNIRARNYLCVAYARTGNFLESLQACQIAVQMAPQDNEVWNNLGTTLDKLGKIKEAEAAFKKAFELQPNNAYTHYNLGWISEENGNKQEAIKEYQKALQTRPDLISAQKRLNVLTNSP